MGRTAAFCLAEENVVDNLVLFAREDSLAKIEGESLDMYDAMAAKDISIKIESSCSKENLHDSDIVVITAGIPRDAGMSRSDIAIPNARIVATRCS